MTTNDIGIYIHIPYCVRKCLYCDFCSTAERESAGEYVKALLSEMEGAKGLSCDSVFIGGGTPSVLGKELLRVSDGAEKYFKIENNAEYTVEVNPGTVDYELLREMKNRGVNRLSIGAQSFNDNELAALGRIHTVKDIYAAFDAARCAGFENINLDLMLSTPNQTIKSVKNTLNRVKELAPEHVSAYSLIIEENTPFYGMELNLPDEDEEREIYRYTVEFLGDAGLSRYEISNFARGGFESRHNMKYWTEKEYIGFGAAAHSFYKNERFSNTGDINMYIKGLGRGIEREYITPKEREKERFMLGLRLAKGIKYEGEFEDIIKKLVSEGLLEIKEGYVRLTEKGFDLGNLVFMEFV